MRFISFGLDKKIILNTLYPCSVVWYSDTMVFKGFRTLSQDVEEGICQVLAHMWLSAELTSSQAYNNVASTSYSGAGKRMSKFERKLGELFKHQIESDMSPVYGDGFRAGQMAVNKYGLRSTLDHIQMTGTFPHWNWTSVPFLKPFRFFSFLHFFSWPSIFTAKAKWVS